MKRSQVCTLGKCGVNSTAKKCKGAGHASASLPFVPVVMRQIEFEGSSVCLECSRPARDA